MMQLRLAAEIFPVEGRAIFRYFRVMNYKSSACNQEILGKFKSFSWFYQQHASFDIKRKQQLLSYFCQNFRIPSWRLVASINCLRQKLNDRAGEIMLIASGSKTNNGISRKMKTNCWEYQQRFHK